MPLRISALRFLCIAVLFWAVAGYAASPAEVDWTPLKNWSLRKTKDGYMLLHATGAVPPYRVFLDGGEPKLLSWELAASNPLIALLHYHSGSAGTSQFYSVTRTIVIDRTQRKILGIVLKAYTPEGKEPKLRQPLWTWAKRQLTVLDREYGGEEILRW